MNDKTDREIMQQALEVLVQHVKHYDYEQFTSVCELEPAKDLILALRERLAKPDPLQRFTDVQQEIEAALAQPAQEPVACIVKGCRNHRGEGLFIGELCSPCHTFITTGEGKYSQAYRNSQREWQGLTYAEMWTLVDEHLKYQLESYEVRVFNLIRAVEAKLKEKNT